MKSYKISLFVIASLVFIYTGCKEENPVIVDDEFKGITETGPDSPEPIGNIDPDDWLNGFDYSSNDTLPGILTFAVYPAYPNPTTRYSAIQVVISTPDSVVIRIEDRLEKKDTIYFASYLLPGVYQFQLDFKYGNDNYIRNEGLIRVHIEVPSRKQLPKVHGDIKYIK